jgi:mRNA interferase MazF
MVVLATGEVVLVPFPFSDLSHTKLRPALILAEAGRNDWVLCQITSNPYADSKAIEILHSHFSTGALRVASYARPNKLFTANDTLMVSHIGTLRTEAFNQIVRAAISLLQTSIKP